MRQLAKESFKLLQENPFHPSLRLKRAGKFWSARISLDYRVLGDPVPGGIVWFWVGSHEEYDQRIRGKKG